MNKIIIVVIGVLVVIGGAYAYTSNQKEVAMMEQKKMEEQKMMIEKKTMEEKEKMDMEKKEGDMMMEKTDDSMMADDAMMKKDESAMMDKSDDMMKMGSYEAYSADKIARAETGDVVLFFHASWCPSCRGLNASIEENMKSIPEGVSILKVDYDKETELKKKYAVTYQHTLVQVDKDGNQIKKWSGSGSLDKLLAEVQ